MNQRLMEKAVRILERETHSYKVDISVDVSSDSEKFFAVEDTVTVGFELDMDIRSWGIKEILVVPHGKAEIRITDKDERSHVLEVNLEGIEVKYNPGQAYVPEQLNVVLSKDFQVVEASLDVYYLDKS